MSIPAEFTTDDGTPPIALVTGAAKRVGRALGTALARRGFRLAIHCNNSRAEAEALAAELVAEGCPEPLIVSADLAEPDTPARIFAALPAPPRLLVNNASLFIEDSFGSIDLALWQRQMAVNLLAPVLLSQTFAAALPEGKGGLIVNLSDAKLSSPNPDFFSYSISKVGLAGATELSARALAPHIRVNAIAPSVTLVSGPQSRQNFEQAHVMNALGRGVDVSDLMRALLYLVETPTVTGQTLVIDGGQRFLALPRDVAYMAAP
ncbi:SDR family NAD(P)-dependent oxidoreductase [Sandaracinobacter neustonicus]|uniref:SDR family NAD(P)-dependent oxidoreductase n=2 Tax=Sandaracinobacter neustonicus TaxID=1715348 RepID=A0A501XU80_9SPHN|nr:SDR family NAD(P)-dependent oxidoreductase [Sandaracinobacter neustonicus]